MHALTHCIQCQVKAEGVDARGGLGSPRGPNILQSKLGVRQVVTAVTHPIQGRKVLNVVQRQLQANHLLRF